MDPIVYSNPYLPGVKYERFSDGKEWKLLICPKCRNKGLVFVHAPGHRAYRTRCIKCGAVHVVKDRETTMRDVQQLGTRLPVGPTLPNGAIDATRRYQELKRMREYGEARARRK